ncbi:lysis protein [Escherichia albertii]|nr:lysis protein [Escherichia albertii]
MDGTGGFFVFLYFHFLSAGTGYWLLQLLDKVSPSQWVAIGVLGSLLFGLLTYLTNLYFKIREDRRKAARGE